MGVRRARGGLTGKLFPWGNDLEPGGEHRMNVWQGKFPVENTLADGYFGTAPVTAFPPNGNGLHNATGNVWEWCADWFDPGYYRVSPIENPTGPERGTNRVMRGGSYLCHASYCRRYRVGARQRERSRQQHRQPRVPLRSRRLSRESVGFKPCVWRGSASAPRARPSRR